MFPRWSTAVLLALFSACFGAQCLAGENGWTAVESPVETALRAVWFPSKDDVFAVGDEGVVLRSRDGGVTWKGQRVFRGLNDCFWTSPREGWAVGSGVFGNFIGGPPNMPPLMTNKTARIIKTTDAGETWLPVDAPDPGERKQLRSLWFEGKTKGVAVGDGGAVLFTTDGGRSWAMCEKATEHRLNGVVLQDGEGWAVGEEGVVLHSADEGKTWKVEETPAKKDLFGLHFDEKGKAGVAVGEGGVILRFHGTEEGK